jgi:hypothetical protein
MGQSSRWIIRGSRLLQNFLGRIERWSKYREVASCIPKRLPSRRWAVAHRISASRLGGFICVYLRSFHPGEFRGCGWFLLFAASRAVGLAEADSFVSIRGSGCFQLFLGRTGVKP